MGRVEFIENEKIHLKKQIDTQSTYIGFRLKRLRPHKGKRMQ